MPGTTVREATPGELDDAGRVVAQAYRADGHAHEDYLVVIADAAARARDATVLVAVEGDAVVGSVTYAEAPSPWAEISHLGEAEFRMLGVAPSARGQGVGRALVEACIDRARGRGAPVLRLCTEPGMTAAHTIYQHFGFERDPDRDWSPVPGIQLLAYVLEL